MRRRFHLISAIMLMIIITERHGILSLMRQISMTVIGIGVQTRIHQVLQVGMMTMTGIGIPTMIGTVIGIPTGIQIGKEEVDAL